MSTHVHHWIEMARMVGKVIAICNAEPHKCKKREEFTEAEWNALAEQGLAKNRPKVL